MKRIFLFLVIWLLIAGAIAGGLLYHFPWRNHEAREAQEEWESFDRELMIERLKKLQEMPEHADALSVMLDSEKTIEENVDDVMSTIDRERSKFERLPCWKSPPEELVTEMVTTIRGNDGQEREVDSFEIQMLAAREPNAYVEAQMSPRFRSFSWVRAWDRFKYEIAVSQVIAAGAVGLVFVMAFVFTRKRAKRTDVPEQAESP